MKKAIQLSVNGERISAEVEPRAQLADFLRDQLFLTGTHLGCEHGVCGACTVEVDGAPARSCITYAVTCNGSAVRTIEGFDDDAVMAELRDAFSAEHALQCGYCTPGMLVTARDIVMRIPNADEARIRKELAGNLCRCTGYVGIVKAIQRVLAARGGKAESSARRSSFDSTALRSGRTEDTPAATISAVRPDGSPVAPRERPKAPPQTTLHQTFTVDHPRQKVWDFFGQLHEVTTCLPGASVTGMPSPDQVDVTMQVKVGPIAPEFEGTAQVERDASNYAGVIRGSAKDRRSSSSTRGEIRYVLLEEKGGAATRVELDVAFALTGALAQFSRSGIVQDIATRLTAAFAKNLEARLNHSQAAVRELDAGSLVMSAIWNRVKAFFRSLPHSFGKGKR